MKNPIGYAKAKELIIKLIRELGGDVSLTLSRICNLLFFIDFSHYLKFTESITGLDYRMEDVGPRLECFDDLMGELSRDLRVVIEPVEGRQEAVFRFWALRPEDSSLFSLKELESIAEAIERFREGGPTVEQLKEYYPAIRLAVVGEKLPLYIALIA